MQGGTIMKTKRLDSILAIIQENDISTQEELQAALRRRGFDVTQATVSRDIRHLQLIKRQSEAGRSVYALPENRQSFEQDRLMRVLRDAVRSAEDAQNILVIKTEAGMAMAAAAAIDSISIEGVVGCIAGDDTIMAVMRTPEDAAQARARLVRDLNLKTALFSGNPPARPNSL